METILQKYSDFKPTQFDHNIDIDRENWLVAPCSVNRDSEPFTRSNWEQQEKALQEISEEGEGWEIHRFGHWACGWFEILIVEPNSKQSEIAENLAISLEDYPLLDECHASELEHEEANEVWKNCYNESDRIEYIRKNRSQFDFRDWKDLVSCVRGEYFGGYASELIA